MTFIEKLEYLMKLNNLNKKKLSDQIGMPYTTIDALFKVGYSNIKLSNFKKICDFFGVTMDYMARDEISEVEYYMPNKSKPTISDAEAHIIDRYRSADPIEKEIVHRALGIDSKSNTDKVGKIS